MSNTNAMGESGPTTETTTKADKELYRLQKRIDELDNELADKSSQLRTLTKQNKAVEESERALRIQLDTFTKQAKDTYRKYEAFLMNAEELIGVYRKFALGIVEVFEQGLDSITLERKMDVKDQISALLSDEDQKKMKQNIEKLVTSQYLKKKNLFKDGEANLTLMELIKVDDIQARVDKIVDDLQNRKSTSDVTVIRRSMTTIGPEIVTEKTREQKIFSTSSINDENKEEAFDYFCRGFFRFSQAIADLFVSEFEFDGLTPDVFMTLCSKTSAVLECFKRYLMKMADVRPDRKVTYENLNMEIAESKVILTDTEKINIQKLTELRAKHNNLILINNHIDILSRENEDLLRKLATTEFNLLEQNEMIRSLEKNIKKKEVFLADKEKELDKVRNQAESMEAETSSVLMKTFKIEEDLVKAAVAQKDAKLALANHKISLELKQDQLRKLQTEHDLLAAQSTTAEQTLKHLISTIAKLQEETPSIAGRKTESERKLAEKEKHLQQSIKIRIREALDRFEDPSAEISKKFF